MRHSLKYFQKKKRRKKETYKNSITRKKNAKRQQAREERSERTKTDRRRKKKELKAEYFKVKWKEGPLRRARETFQCNITEKKTFSPKEPIRTNLARAESFSNRSNSRYVVCCYFLCVYSFKKKKNKIIHKEEHNKRKRFI